MEYSLHIENGMTPQTIPMDRLAEYMAALADLLGEKAKVHFHEVREGCVAIAAWVDDESVAAVDARLSSITADDKAHKRTNDLFRKDNGRGDLRKQEAVVIPFPGNTAPRETIFGPFKQTGSIAGELVRIEGSDETIHLTLRDGKLNISCLTTTKTIARDLASKLFRTIRVTGQGTWYRDESGHWNLTKFKVTNFEDLDDTPLAETIKKLRDVEGSEWGNVPDPVAELLADRWADGKAHLRSLLIALS